MIYITDTDEQKIYIIINMELEIKIGYVQTEEDAIKMCEKLSKKNGIRYTYGSLRRLNING